MSDAKVIPIEVTPLGYEMRPAFVSRDGGACSYEQVQFAIYPGSPRGEELRALRTRLGVSLRRASWALGIGVVEMSGLERGGFTLSGEDWKRAADVLRGLKPEL